MSTQKKPIDLSQAQAMLCPAGNGVYTVNTAKERKAALHSEIYNEENPDKVEKAWKDSFAHFLKTAKDSPVGLLGICSDCGGGIQRGANWGPLFIRQNLYEGHPWHKEDNFFDLGDIRVIPHLLHDKYLNEETLKNCRKSLYGDENSPHSVSPLSMTESICDSFYNQFPKGKLLCLGGDHSVSYPTVKSFLQHKKSQGIKVGLIHFDAHTDLLVERLGIDLCFGSWVTHILDDLPGADYCYQLGIRSSGKERNHWEKTFGVQQFWNGEFNKVGPVALADKVLKDLKDKGVQELYVSFDIDALDETEVSATGTPEPGGLKLSDCIVFIQKLKEEIPLTGADLMEVAPFLSMPMQDPSSRKINPEPESTLLAAETIAATFLEAML